MRHWLVGTGHKRGLGGRNCILIRRIYNNPHCSPWPGVRAAIARFDWPVHNRFRQTDRLVLCQANGRLKSNTSRIECTLNNTRLQPFAGHKSTGTQSLAPTAPAKNIRTTNTTAYAEKCRPILPHPSAILVWTAFEAVHRRTPPKLSMARCWIWEHRINVYTIYLPKWLWCSLESRIYPGQTHGGVKEKVKS
jgi:hypothetical protein